MKIKTTDLSDKNKQAWDSLYGSTEELIWGHEIPDFILDYIDELANTFSQDSRILDAATGEGRNLSVLQKLGVPVFACDSSIHALKKSQYIQDTIRVQCDLSKLPFDTESFDFVLLIDVIETLPEPDEILEELNRILKPGGKLLCNIPGMEDEISSVDMESLEQNSFLYRDQYFYHFMTELEALNLIQSKGFSVLRNEIKSWQEDAHPNFRGSNHTHTSRVFLLQKG